MEDGVSSILYIIITAIIILVGVLGKKKKPQQIPGGSGNGKTGGIDFFEKFGLREQEEQEGFIDVEEDEEITEIPVEKETHRVSVTSAFNDQSDKKAEVTEKVFEEETEEVDAYEISDEIDNELNEIKDEFDLKKAIIYSEIINRKYE
jgi:hypothetical protein